MNPICENNGSVSKCQNHLEALRLLYSDDWFNKTEVFRMLAARVLCANCPINLWRQSLITNPENTTRDFGNDF